MREMFDDDAARRALQTLNDDQAPPVTTTLDQVVRRGRRRLFVQRASAVAGVVAVVAAIGVGAILLRTGDDGDGVRVANQPTSAPTGDHLPGWTPVPLPASTRRSENSCQQPYVELPPEVDIPLASEVHVRDAYVNAAEQVVGRVGLTNRHAWMTDSPRHGGPRGYLNLEVPMANGNGQLMLEAGRFGGTPEQVANASITVYGNCGEPLRHRLADGTVLQLYPLDDRDQQAPSQHLQIYRPNGLVYVITSAGWSDADLTPPDTNGSQTLAGGRGTVPVTEEQLVAIGQGLVRKLG